MKHFFKCFSVYICVLLLLSFFAFPNVVSFASNNLLSFTFDVPGENYYNNEYVLTSDCTYSGQLSLYASADIGSDVGFVGFPAGTYTISGDLTGLTYTGLPPMQVLVVDLGSGFYRFYDFGEEFTISSADSSVVIVQSFTEPLVTRKSTGLFYSAWDLLAESIYGYGVELTPEMNLTLTILCTVCALAVVLVPFFLIYWVLRFIFRW